jgi:hypothetical protein
MNSPIDLAKRIETYTDQPALSRGLFVRTQKYERMSAVYCIRQRIGKFSRAAIAQARKNKYRLTRANQR